MRSLLRIPAAIVIWFLFWVAGIVAPIACLVWALVRWDKSPISHAFHAQNRTAATVLGFNGRLTISSELGLRHGSCSACRRFCAFLSLILNHPNHCEEEARDKR